VIVTLLLTAGKLIAVGFCLGFGYYLCKELTKKIDEYRAVREHTKKMLLEAA
jgi:hypothetical protein